MPAGVDDDGLRWSTPYSEIIGTALGSIIAAIMTPHAAKNVIPSATPVPTIGICAWNSTAAHAAADSANSVAPEKMAARARGTSVRALLMTGARYHAHSGRPTRWLAETCWLSTLSRSASGRRIDDELDGVWSLQRVEVDAHPLCCLDELVDQSRRQRSVRFKMQ